MSALEQVYYDTAKVLKALSDPKRLRIVDMLSCGELCACKILESFHVTHPILSHNMKILVEAKIVKDRRESKNCKSNKKRAIKMELYIIDLS